MKKITPEEIKKIQLDLLIQFAEFCKKNNLYYCLAYGTLLGAIRHKGFIPWDDDIDVIMPRPDYEKFCKLVAEKKIATSLQNNSTYPFVKIIDTRTLVRERFAQKEEVGIWIDVFVLDGNFNNRIINFLHYKIAFVIKKILEIIINIIIAKLVFFIKLLLLLFSTKIFF